LGKGVEKAVSQVNTTIARAIANQDLDQTSLDKLLIELDGTENKNTLGANAILSVSLAFAWAMSRAQNLALYQYIGALYDNDRFIMPRPLFNVLNGGEHGDWATDIQEYMVIPAANLGWSERLRLGSEVFHHLAKVLKEKGYSISVGNEGGFAPAVASNQEALDLIVQAISRAGYKLGEQVTLGFDAAASEFYNEQTQQYELKRDGRNLSSEEMISWVEQLTSKYPVELLEDMLSQDDWTGWTTLTAKLGGQAQIVGDDLLVTNTRRIEQAISQQACNSLLVKLNQIGTLTETLMAMKMAKGAGWSNVVSHRSGETEDVTIAHLAVGTGCGWLKTGAPSRGERTAKYNELTRIAEQVE
jgi:enolase